MGVCTCTSSLGQRPATSRCSYMLAGFATYVFNIPPPNYKVPKSKDPGLYLKPQHSVLHVGGPLSMLVEGMR